jgi:2-polyprenyl-3-methyl-5-hydroxy-6-metoxy-1,4-benzoquinol methylase
VTTAFSPEVYLITNCPLCQSTHLRPGHSERNIFPKNAHDEVKAFSFSWIQLLKCDDCGFVFTKEIPSSKSFFANRYDNYHFNPSYESNSVRKNEILSDIFNRLQGFGKSGGNFLDVGSFAGQLLKFAQSRGFTPMGVELNPKLANYSKDVLGFQVFQGEFQTVELPQNHFEVITIIDVLEHLVDPYKVLKNLYGALNVGGILVVKVPNYPMQRPKQWIANKINISDVGIFAGFAHINHFSEKSLSRALKSLGFEILEVEIAPSEEWTVTGNTFFRNQLNRLKNFIRSTVFVLSAALYKILGINLGLNLNFYAKKIAR